VAKKKEVKVIPLKSVVDESEPEKAEPEKAETSVPTPTTIKECWQRTSEAQDGLSEDLADLTAKVNAMSAEIQILRSIFSTGNVGEGSPVDLNNLREMVAVNRRALLALRELFDSHEQDLEKGRQLLKKYGA